MRSMMSVVVGRLPHGLMPVLVVVGVGLAFLISGSSARADTIVRGGLNTVGGGGRRVRGCVHRRRYDNRVVVDKPNGTGGYTQSVVDDTGLSLPRGWRSMGPGTCSSPTSGDNRVVVDKPNGSGGYTQQRGR